MALQFHHAGKYTGEEFTIDEVIASLAAQKELIEAGLQFLAQLDPDFRYEGAKIRVESITTSSLLWDLVVEVYGRYQHQIEDRTIGSLEEMFGVDIPAEYEGIITLALLAVTYVAARYAYERVARSKNNGTPSVHIHGDNNVVLQNLGEITGATPEEVQAALDRSLPPSQRRRLIPKVADLFRPARKSPGGQIQFLNAPDIPTETLKEFPSDADLQAVDDSVNVDVEGAIVDIRGTDRDRHKQGWGALILNDDRFPKRLPMDLYPTVDPEALADHRTVRADLVVECERRADNRLRAKRIHLLNFRAPD